MARKKDDRQERGITNREATEDMKRGGLKQAERGNKSLNTNRPRARKGETVDTRRTRDDAEMRPAAATRSQRPAAGRGNEVEPEHIPGTTGRPKHQRSPDIEDTEPGNVYEGEAAGATRAVRVTNANRRRKKVA